MAVEPQVQTELALSEEVAAALTRGATILAPHLRAARTLRQAFDAAARRRAETLWSAPPIFALESWLGKLWNELLIAGDEDRLLLNRSQEHQLWRTILASDKDLSGLQTLDSLALLAAQGWERLWHYGGRRQLQPAATTPDTQAFARWAVEFDSICLRRRYLTWACLPEVLTEAMTQNRLRMSNAGFALVDFAPLASAQAKLFESVRAAGFPVANLSSRVVDAGGELCVAADDSSELRTAAQWLRKTSLASPSTRLALVVANLAERRADIDRALTDAYGSSSTGRQGASAWEFSLGQPIAETAAAFCALILLRWSLGPLSIDSISRLLLSPYFTASDPALYAAAAEFDVCELRRSKLLRPELTLHQCVLAMERSSRRTRLAHLLGRMKNAARNPLDLNAVNSPAQWAEEFRSLLEVFGWTDATDRDSLSWQVREQWESALDELSTLNFDNALVSAATAHDMLSRIAGTTMFTPRSHDAPVQVIGPLEVGGVAFDAVWFIGADDAGWPPPTSPHPLLPWTMQRTLGMPGADSERDAQAARALTNTIAGSAPRVIFSFAQNAQDQVRRPSPMLAGLRLAPVVLEALEPKPTQTMQTCDDSEALPFLHDRILRGGARVLQLQAACAFRAFAEMRLFSTEPENPEQGFDARESGIVIHLVMQHFWGIASTQQGLREMSEAERNQLLRESIEVGLEKSLRNIQTRWDRAYLEVQRHRLFTLLKPWLNVELARPPFEVRVREEAIEDVAIGPLRLRLRVDRVDNTQGGPLIIDYKSGHASYKDWAGDRPDAPQLPLYGVLTEGDRLGGLAFAVLRAGKGLVFEGVADNSNVLARSKALEEASMLAQVQRWKSVLESLAQEFARGSADVLPKDYPRTCKHCEQRILCRLDVSALGAAADDQDDEEDVSGSQEDRIDG